MCFCRMAVVTYTDHVFRIICCPLAAEQDMMCDKLYRCSICLAGSPCFCLTAGALVVIPCENICSQVFCIIHRTTLVHLSMDHRVIHPGHIKPSCFNHQISCDGSRKVFQIPVNDTKMMVTFRLQGRRQPSFWSWGLCGCFYFSPMLPPAVRFFKIHAFRMMSPFRLTVPYFTVSASTPHGCSCY